MSCRNCLRCLAVLVAIVLPWSVCAASSEKSENHGESEVTIDLSRLKMPVDAWFAISIDQQLVGYEHLSIHKKADGATLRSDLAFELGKGGPQPAFKVYHVSAKLMGLQKPILASAIYRFGTNFSILGRRMKADDGSSAEWRANSSWNELDGDKVVNQHRSTTMPCPEDQLPDFGLELLATGIPQQTGNCCRIHVMNLGAGDIAEAGLLRVADSHIETGSQLPPSPTQIDYLADGKVTLTIWVDPAGKVVRFHRRLYSQFHLTGALSTRDEVLHDMPEAIRPEASDQIEKEQP